MLDIYKTKLHLTCKSHLPKDKVTPWNPRECCSCQITNHMFLLLRITLGAPSEHDVIDQAQEEGI